MNRRTLTHYKGICQKIETFVPREQREEAIRINSTKPLGDETLRESRQNLPTLQIPEIQPTVVQLDTIKDTVILKSQLHFQYHKNRKCLEMVNAVNYFFEIPSAYNIEKKTENGVEIILRLKKRIPPN